MESICPICLEDFADKVRASPDACDHVFCLQCLEKWSKLGSYCPVDRKRYKKIFNLNSDDIIKIKPPKRKRRGRRTLYDFSAACEVCSKDDNSEMLLLCDCCDLGYHLHCFSPPLKEVPSGLWFCPTCVSVENKLKEKHGITKETEADNCSGIERSSAKKRKIKEKEAKIARNDTEESERNQSTCSKSIIQTCHSVVNEFEDISAHSCSENACPSNYLIDDFTELEKIHKTFSFAASNSSHKRTNCTKTYDLCKKSTNKPRPKTSMGVQFIESPVKNRSNVDDKCLKNNVAKDVSLLELYLSESVGYGHMKPDNLIDNEDAFQVCGSQLQKYINKKHYQNDSNSNTNCLQSELKNTFEINVEKNSDSCIQSKANDENFIGVPSENGDILQNMNSTTNEVNVDEESQRNSIQVANEKHDDALPSYKSKSKRLSKKGTFDCLNSEFLNESSEQVSKNLQFSVFDRLDDIDVSQKKYAEINSLISSLFSSNLQMRHCLICNEMIFVKSLKYCKICKLRYFKKSTNTENCRKHKKDLKRSQNFTKLCDIYVSSHSAKLNKEVSAIKKCKTRVLRRRQRSLERKLQKIQDSKLKSVTNNV